MRERIGVFDSDRGANGSNGSRVGPSQGRIGGLDPKTGTLEQATSDMCAKPSIERFDGVAFGEGDVGRVFRGGAAGGDAGLEEGRPEALMAERWGNAKSEQFAAAMVVRRTSDRDADDDRPLDRSRHVRAVGDGRSDEGVPGSRV